MKKNKSDLTVYQYQNILKKYYQKYGEITQENIQEYIKKKSYSFVRTLFSALIWKFHTKKSDISRLIEIRDNIMIDKSVSVVRENKPLSKEEFVEIRKSKNENLNFVLFMVYTGLRADEMINLKKYWKSNADEVFFLGKNRQKRYCFIPEFLQKWFITTDFNKINYQFLNRLFASIKKELSWNRIFTPHTARYTFASFLSAKGVPLEKIAVLMGHIEINTTYGYLRNDTNQIKSEWGKLFLDDFEIMNKKQLIDKNRLLQTENNRLKIENKVLKNKWSK